MSLLERRWPKVLLWVCFAAPLAAQAYIGTFSRYFADDYCLTARLFTEGFFGSMAWWYNNWSGRFSYWVFIAVSGSTEPQFAAIFPVVLVGLWLIGLIWIAYELALLLGVRQPLYVGLLLGTLVLFATLDGTPSVFQSLYWFGSTIPYTLPMIPFAFTIGLFLYTLRKRPNGASLGALIIMALLTFFAGGLCEVHAGFQFTALAMIWGVLHRYARPAERRARSMLVVGLASSLIALVIIAVAPGNGVRQEEFPVQFSFPELVVRTILYSFGYMVLALGRFSSIALFVTVVISAMIAYLFPGTVGTPSARRIRQWIILSALAVFVLTAATLVLPLYGLGTAPSSRVYLIPQLALVCAAAFWGYLMGVGLRSRRSSATTPNRKALAYGLVVVVVVVGPLASTWQTLNQLPDFQTYATEWDARDRAIRTAVGQGVERFETTAYTVDLGEMAGLETITSNPGDWVNICAALYYGLDTIIAEPLLRMGDKT